MEKRSFPLTYQNNPCSVLMHLCIFVVLLGTINGTKTVASKVPIPQNIPVPFIKKKDKKE